MRRQVGRFNFKRRIADSVTEAELEQWSASLRYGGNPEHKRNPGDFGLRPPAAPRADKSLCDDVGIFSRAEAIAVLRAGLQRGLVSEQRVNDLPQLIWSVTAQDRPVEAQLENSVACVYHAYPMPEGDPLASVVLARWRSHERGA